MEPFPKARRGGDVASRRRHGDGARQDMMTIHTEAAAI